MLYEGIDLTVELVVEFVALTLRIERSRAHRGVRRKISQGWFVYLVFPSFGQGFAHMTFRRTTLHKLAWCASDNMCVRLAMLDYDFGPKANGGSEGKRYAC